MILAYVSNSKLGRECNIKTWQYFGQCYSSIDEAIRASDIVDMVYACYTLIVLAFEMLQPTATIVTHLKGFCQGIKVVQSTSILLGTREFCGLNVYGKIFSTNYIIGYSKGVTIFVF